MFLRVIFVLLLLVTLSVLLADNIVLAADPWMPYNGEPQSGKPGYCIEIAKTVFEKAGHKVDYQVMPYSRAIQGARTGSVVGVVGATESDVPDFVFPENELGISNTGFYVKKGDNWKYSGVSSLRNKKIGVIMDYTYGDEVFDQYISESEKSKSSNVYVSTGDNPLERLIQMLSAGRLDIVIEDKLVMQYNLNLAKKQSTIIQASDLSSLSKVYIAFPPNNPKSKEYARILSDGIAEMRKSGELKKILAKYGLADWKK